MTRHVRLLLQRPTGAALGLVLLGAAALGGCTCRPSSQWAQTSPVVAPSYDGSPVVHLGTLREQRPGGDAIAVE